MVSSKPSRNRNTQFLNKIKKNVNLLCFRTRPNMFYQGPLQHSAIGKQKNVDENSYGSIYQGIRIKIILRADCIEGNIAC